MAEPQLTPSILGRVAEAFKSPPPPDPKSAQRDMYNNYAAEAKANRQPVISFEDWAAQRATEFQDRAAQQQSSQQSAQSQPFQFSK